MQSPKLTVVRKASFTPRLWKNGGGITHEAIRVPATGDPFRWRVSVAHIDASGPFSEFAEYNRTMVLLRGAGVELRFAGGRQARLSEVGELVKFDGAEASYCELLNGPCADLNLMVWKSDRFDARVSPVSGSMQVQAAQEQCTLVFCITGEVVLNIDSGESATLGSWDLAVLRQCEGKISVSAVGGLPSEFAAPSVFVASLWCQ